MICFIKTVSPNNGRMNQEENNNDNVLFYIVENSQGTKRKGEKTDVS